jgi:DNA-binding LacI/PurR family transcriptional regulator
MESVAREHGYSLLVGNSDEDEVDERAVLEQLRAHGLAGLILTPAAEWPNEVDTLLGLPLPIILFDRLLSQPVFDSVVVDNAGGSRQAVQHLIALGHRRIGLITGPLHKTPDQERRRGYVEAFNDAGLALWDDLLVPADSMRSGGYQAALRLIGRPDRPSALYVASNMMAIGALEAIRTLGIRVPEEISFVGFDDIEVAKLMSPPPTVVDRPMYEQGATAMRLLVDRIRRGANDAPRHIVMDTKLIVRESTALFSAPDGGTVEPKSGL